MEVSFQVADDDTGDKDWRTRMLQVPGKGDEVLRGDPDKGFKAFVVKSVHWQLREQKDGFTTFGLVSVFVEEISR